MYHYIYGPVVSRRLGFSLGVDLVPYKVCSFNCVYCECGKNTLLTLERKEYYPIEDILSEVRDFLSKNSAPDFLSLSGSGEPTLHSKIGYFIQAIKKEFPSIKIAVLTNGSLLCQQEVREELMDADVVLPSLDAATEKAYLQIDRPFSQLNLPEIIEGIALFTKNFKQRSKEKQVWLEIFIIDGINTDKENVLALKNAVLKIQPDRIQLNTLDRPGTEEWVKPASRETLEKVKESLGFPECEIVAKVKDPGKPGAIQDQSKEAVFNTIKRRPSTLEDLTEALGLSTHDAGKILNGLEKEDKIIAEEGARGIFYRAK
jgi:wyosine [tRNA(Phe)-imidazoG37] synthetase (radical SAM superfamily)